MGLFSKVKNILFDEDVDLTEQIKITPEMRNEEIPVKVVNRAMEMPKEEVSFNKAVKSEPVHETVKENISERDIFKNDSYPFLDFDEEEFDKQKVIPKEPPKEVNIQPKRQVNALEYERKKRIEKRTDYGRYEKTEITETTERRKFRPSPIISPVYGILNQDYIKDDIKQRKYNDKVDINEVRNKAFGETKVVKENIQPQDELPRRDTSKYEPRTSYYNERETVTITKPEEKERKVKTIDELLENTSDVMVDMRKEIEDNFDFALDDNYEPKEKESTKEMVVPNVDDTLENDLFDLIDSMYDSKEDGE